MSPSPMLKRCTREKGILIVFRNRIIPVLLLMDSSFVKTRKFKKPVYLGDSVNICKLFSEKQVDELVILDITASKEKRGPNFDLIQRISDESFVPFSYGGGIRNVEDALKVIQAGAEKVIVNTLFQKSPSTLAFLSTELGSQSVVVSMDVKKAWWNSWEWRVRGNKSLLSLQDLCKEAVDYGAGEILLQDMDRDGMMAGYDLALVKSVSDSVSIPVTVCGGAGSLDDMKKAIDAGACGAAAGSLFVYHGPHNGVMINYPTRKTLEEVFCGRLRPTT